MTARATGPAISPARLASIGVFEPLARAAFLDQRDEQVRQRQRLGAQGLHAAVTLTLIWALTLMNCRGAILAGRVQLVTTLLKIIPLIVVIGVAVFGERLAGPGWAGVACLIAGFLAPRASWLPRQKCGPAQDASPKSKGS